MQNIYKGSGFSVKVLNIIDSIIYTSYILEATLYAEVYDSESSVIGYVGSIGSSFIEVILVKNIKIVLLDILYIGINQISIKFNNNVLGSIVTPIGDNIMHFTVKENFYNQNTVPIIADSLNINQRCPIDNQLLTGYNVIDILFPIGYGQRMMVIGDSKTYKTTYIIQIIKTILSNRKIINRDQKTIFIYASIGQTNAHLKAILNFLIKNTVGNALIINSACNDMLGMQFLTPYSAMSIANYYAQQGYNIVVILDDLTKHANCYRELMLLNKKPYGRDYYSSDIFFKHSSLLERAFNGLKGSVTTFILTETLDEEITSYIATNIISITDGQLVFTKDMLKKDIMPPISTRYSVSRVGFNAQSKILNKVATLCNMALSNYYANLDFFNMYRDNCNKTIKEHIYLGMYIINMIYKIYPDITIDYLKQVIIVAVIDSRVYFDQYSVDNIMEDGFRKKIIKLIENVYSVAIKNKVIMDKLIANINDITIIEDINNEIKIYLKNE